MLRDPQVLARRMVEAVQHATLGPLKVLGTPIKLSETPGSVRTAPPTLGQHTDAVLGEIGIPDATIAALRARRVI